MKLIEAQLMQMFAYALRDHAEIVSGAYKQRTTQCGTGENTWRDETDEEKLKDAMGTMTAHCGFILDIVNNWPADSKDGK